MDERVELLRRARGGDERALAAFIRATQADVWRFCSYLATPAEADDLTQETYLRAFRAAPSFRFDSSPRTWLFAIARRAVADHQRQATRRRRTETRLSSAPSPTSSPDPAGAITTDSLIRSLPADRRAAFVLTQIVGMSYDEAAAACSCEVGTIRSRVFRAREDLRVALAADDIAEDG